MKNEEEKEKIKFTFNPFKRQKRSFLMMVIDIILLTCMLLLLLKMYNEKGHMDTLVIDSCTGKQAYHQINKDNIDDIDFGDFDFLFEGGVDNGTTNETTGYGIQ